MRLGLVIVILIGCVGSAFAQKITDIEASYGKPSRVYSASEHIWMSPEYAPDGQVCRVRVFPKRIEGDTNYLSQQLPFDELRDFLNLFVPLNQRGKKEQLFGSTDMGRPASWTTYGYERVRFVFLSQFSSLAVGNSRVAKHSGYDLASQEVRPPSSEPADDDFLPSQTADTQIVTITWNGRKCTGQ